MIFHKNKAAKTKSERPKGGDGQILGLSFVNDSNRPANTRTAMIATNTLPVGSTIGFHVHDADEEAYLILEGQGRYTDADKLDYEVSAGDWTLTREGEGHALANTGDVPLVFAAIIYDAGK
ncbi:MAG: cupin domain-containing protein [Deltaproteobacteria bacterium]|nr:cupin domain-containing protein [Deltaproteobacteria bacterium]